MVSSLNFPCRRPYILSYQTLQITKKIVLIVLDGVGIGELPDASLYGDEGSNTLVNMAAAVRGLRLPHLEALGLGNIAAIEGVSRARKPRGSYGKMAEISAGKDSTTGHWELAGIVVEKAFPTFPHGFPASLLQHFLEVTGTNGYLGNKTASGTRIIQELGDEHLRTGYPIVYTSADSVFQIAAHEEVIPVDRLYEMCRLTRDHVCTGEYAVGRVIARPFTGVEGDFTRTRNRKDFSLLPPGPTVLDVLLARGIETIGVGKIDDLFADQGLKKTLHTRSNREGIEAIIRLSASTGQCLIIANLGDFDTLYGHRNDPQGFARALEEFDGMLPAIEETLTPGDLLILTADHGNDPVALSTDHSREYVPLLCCSKSKEYGSMLGTRKTFADVGKTIADCFGVDNALSGESFLSLVQ